MIKPEILKRLHWIKKKLYKLRYILGYIIHTRRSQLFQKIWQASLVCIWNGNDFIQYHVILIFQDASHKLFKDNSVYLYS